MPNSQEISEMATSFILIYQQKADRRLRRFLFDVIYGVLKLLLRAHTALDNALHLERVGHSE